MKNKPKKAIEGGQKKSPKDWTKIKVLVINYLMFFDVSKDIKRNNSIEVAINKRSLTYIFSFFIFKTSLRCFSTGYVKDEAMFCTFQ